MELLTAYVIEINRSHLRNGVTYRLENGRNSWAPGEDEFTHRFRASAGEYAASMLTGLEWHWEAPPAGGPKPVDLGRRTEVRTTRYPSGKLSIRDRDDPECLYLLMVASGLTYRAAGWMEGRDLLLCPVETSWAAPNPAAAQSELLPLPLPEDA